MTVTSYAGDLVSLSRLVFSKFLKGNWISRFSDNFCPLNMEIILKDVWYPLIAGAELSTLRKMK